MRPLWIKEPTTLWENLTGSGDSKDHQFLGDVAAWLVHDVVGIDQDPGSREYRQLVIRPAIVGGLTHAAGSHVTPQGPCRGALDAPRTDV